MNFNRLPTVLLVAALPLLLAAGCPNMNTTPTNPDALPAGEGTPNANQFTVNGENKDTGLNFQSATDYANDPIAPPPAEATPPPSVDLTGKLPPIGDQGQLGSCAAWACGYGLATWNANNNGSPMLDQAASQASPGFLYAKTMEAQQSTCDSGSQMDTVMNLLVSQGCSSLATVPYSDAACSQNPSNTDANKFKIGSFGNLRDPKSRETLKKALAAGRPLAIGVGTQANFSDYKTGVYVAAGGNAGGKHAGHAMVLVGYDDAMGAYRIMNSWNTTWGEAGFMWWEYADFEKACDEAYEAFPVGSGGSPRLKDGGPYAISAEQRRDDKGAMFLIVNLSLPQPIQIEAIHCTDPNGATAVSGYGGNWFAGGPICFIHADGKPWQAGDYKISIRGTRTDGAFGEFSSTAALPAQKAGTAERGTASGFSGVVLGATGDAVELRDAK